MAKLLTKSKYLAGLESDALLWKLVNDPKSLPAPDPFTQAKFDTGTAVGDLVKQIFSGADLSGLGFKENLDRTSVCVESEQTIFEAGFLVDLLYVRSDVLIPANGSWTLVEVKSSTSVKHIHFHDLAFQKYVIEKSGLKVANFNFYVSAPCLTIYAGMIVGGSLGTYSIIESKIRNSGD
jgi:hypothetical protein